MLKTTRKNAFHSISSIIQITSTHSPPPPLPLHIFHCTIFCALLFFASRWIVYLSSLSTFLHRVNIGVIMIGVLVMPTMQKHEKRMNHCSGNKKRPIIMILIETSKKCTHSRKTSSICQFNASTISVQSLVTATRESKIPSIRWPG